MIGRVLQNRYRLDSELGSGGMGTVYRAHDTMLDRDVAVKVMPSTTLGTDGRARFEREAQAAARLNHPNIVSVHDAGKEEDLQFIVMELVEGKSLHKHHPEALEEVITISKQICAALEHAHAHDIIHRDLKPENVMILPDGTAKLVDFGLARPLASRLTVEGTLIGTVFYLAPEQALGNKTDHRADLYALGVTLYELTTGGLPFTADDPLAVITQHLHAPVVPPRSKNHQISSSLNELILQLLEKDPANRPKSAAEVLEILDSPTILEKEDASTPIEETSVLDRIVRGRLVGRERELAEGKSLWKKAVSGESQLLLISGEPGIGKTRLVRELITQAEISGGRALIGVSYAEGDAPYAAFRQIIRQVLHNDDDEDALELPELVLTDLLMLAPELRHHYPNVPVHLSFDPQAEHYRLYASVAALFANLSQRKSLMLVLEDVHWADSGTISLLRYLARSTRSRRLLIIATYREVELDQSRPFQKVLLDLNREKLTTRLKLLRLDRGQTEEILEILFDEKISPESLDSIYRETEGNPFFIEEVCRALVESGKIYYNDGQWRRPDTNELGVPQSVRMAIQSRVKKLPETTQEMLSLAAVIGREFDFNTLVKASQTDEDTLINGLESAERAQLIEELSGDRGGTFLFVHALIPATLVEGLSGMRRRRMHRQIMKAVEELRPDDFESLAYHALKGGDLKNGLDYSLHAAEKAYRLFAIEEALTHYEHAREIAESLELPEQLLNIYQVVGDIQGFRDISQSIEAYEQALLLASDTEKHALIKSKIGMRHAYNADERGLTLLEEAINELNPDTQGNELALAMASVGRFYHNLGQHKKALTYLEKAQQIAEPQDDPRTWSYICIYLAGAYQQLAEFDKSMEWARHSITFGEENNYPPSIAIGYEYLTENAVMIGNWQGAHEFAKQELLIANKTGQLIAMSWAEINLSDTYYGLGDLPAAEKAVQKSLDMAKEMGNVRLAVHASARLSVIQTDLGKVKKAEENAKKTVERANDFSQIVMMAWSSLHALSYWHAQLAEWKNAFEHLDQVAHIIEKTDSHFFQLLNAPLYAEVSINAGKIEKAIEIVEKTLSLATEAPSPRTEAVIRRVQAQILTVQGLWDEATLAYNDAIMQLEKLGSRLELGRALYHLGKMQTKNNETEAAHDSLTRAHKIFKDCSAKLDGERARDALAVLAQ